MKMRSIHNLKVLLLLVAGFSALLSCEKEEVFPQTRLFRPILNEELKAELNTIIINMGNIKDATSYTITISRDTFKSVDYTIESDTNYVVVDQNLLKGDQLFWNTLYQVRAVAHSSDAQYDSKVSELGSVRTERFPTILNVPTSADVIDIAARVSWQLLGAPVTKIKVFAITDLKLTTPLATRDITAAEQQKGVAIVRNLKPSTPYQLAIYSGADGSTLRGWETYTTLAQGIDLSDPNVIDLTQNDDPNAVINAVASAKDGQVIVLQKGTQYNLPLNPLDKSITIRGTYGFGTGKAILFTTSNWNIAATNINHIRFIDVDIRGEDIGGDYVFNPNNSAETNVNELTFDDCIISNMRGIFRIRGKVYVKNLNFNNCVVSKIGNYGIVTADTDGAGGAAFDNIKMTNSTFSKINMFMTTRQNMQSVIIDACTLNEVAAPDGIVFRWRGTKGTLSNVLNGIQITNTIWGPAWDEAKTGNLKVRGIYEGLEATSWNIVNTYAPSDFGFTAGYEIPGFPALSYSGTSKTLWTDPDKTVFTFKDAGFAGKYDSGDPRWRAKL